MSSTQNKERDAVLADIKVDKSVSCSAPCTRYAMGECTGCDALVCEDCFFQLKCACYIGKQPCEECFNIAQQRCRACDTIYCSECIFDESGEYESSAFGYCKDCLEDEKRRAHNAVLLNVSVEGETTCSLCTKEAQGICSACETSICKACFFSVACRCRYALAMCDECEKSDSKRCNICHSVFCHTCDGETCSDCKEEEAQEGPKTKKQKVE